MSDVRCALSHCCMIAVFAAIQMGRPSKTRGGSDVQGADVVGPVSTSPVNLSFHQGSTSSDGRQRPAAALEAPTMQQPDSTADRRPSTSRKRPTTSINVLRQLQSPSLQGGNQTPWSSGGQNAEVCAAVNRLRWAATDVAADLRVKRARHSDVLCPSGDMQSWSVGAKWSEAAAEVGRRWLHDDMETSATLYDAAVGSPSVTSSGRRDSVDYEDDEEQSTTAADCESLMRPPPSSVGVDLPLWRPRSSVDQLYKKQTGLYHDRHENTLNTNDHI